jgi:hypothetical protein
MRVPRQHRLDSMSGKRRQISVVDGHGPELRDIGVVALLGADV